MLVILGDSHTIALRDGLAKLDARSQRSAWACFGGVIARDLSHGYKFFESFFEVDDQGVRFTDPRAVGVLASIPGGFAPITRNDPRTFLFSFGFHPSFAMLVTRWQAHTAARNAPDKHYVSEALVAAAVREHTRPMLEFFGVLKDINVQFSVVMCCPLPKSFITEKNRRVMASEEDILAFRQQYRKVFAQELDRLGVRYFAPPEQACDGQWLKERYVNRKGVGDYHADAQYGALMLQDIIGKLTQGYRIPPPSPKDVLRGVKRRLGRMVRRVTRKAAAMRKHGMRHFFS